MPSPHSFARLPLRQQVMTSSQRSNQFLELRRPMKQPQKFYPSSSLNTDACIRIGSRVIRVHRAILEQMPALVKLKAVGPKVVMKSIIETSHLGCKDFTHRNFNSRGFNAVLDWMYCKSPIRIEYQHLHYALYCARVLEIAEFTQAIETALIAKCDTPSYIVPLALIEDNVLSDKTVEVIIEKMAKNLSVLIKCPTLSDFSFDVIGSLLEKASALSTCDARTVRVMCGLLLHWYEGKAPNAPEMDAQYYSALLGLIDFVRLEPNDFHDVIAKAEEIGLNEIAEAIKKRQSDAVVNAISNSAQNSEMYDSEDATQLNELSIIDEDDDSDGTDMEEAIAWREPRRHYSIDDNLQRIAAGAEPKSAKSVSSSLTSAPSTPATRMIDFGAINLAAGEHDAEIEIYIDGDIPLKLANPLKLNLEVVVDSL